MKSSAIPGQTKILLKQKLNIIISALVNYANNEKTKNCLNKLTLLPKDNLKKCE